MSEAQHWLEAFINGFFALVSRTYEAGALDTETKELPTS